MLECYDRELKQSPFRPAKPVLLHGQDPVGPGVVLCQYLAVSQKCLSEFGYTEEPPLQPLLLDLRSGSPGISIGIDLFAGKNRLIDRVIVHLRFRLVRETLLVQEEKKSSGYACKSWVRMWRVPAYHRTPLAEARITSQEGVKDRRLRHSPWPSPNCHSSGQVVLSSLRYSPSSSQQG